MTQCTPVDASVPLEGGAGQQGHICDALHYGMKLFLPVGGEGPRRAAIHMGVYMSKDAQQPVT